MGALDEPGPGTSDREGREGPRVFDFASAEAVRGAVADAARRGGRGRAIGKAILVGEHFVVHGSPAIAVPVRGRQIEVAIGRAGESEARVARRHPEHERARRAIVAMLGELGVPPSDLDALTFEVGGDLPLGAGLGGSAALAAALGRALGVPRAALPDFVHRMEQLAHGKPSGVDGAVVCAERGVWFEAGEAGPRLSWLDAPVAAEGEAGASRGTARPGPSAEPELPMWLAIVPRVGSTKDAVARVGAFREAQATTFAGLAAAARADALTARDALGVGDLETLGAIFDRAQARLEIIGVSTPALAALVAAARGAGAYGAKLSGAGLGGAVLVVAPPGSNLRPALLAAGAVDVIPPVGWSGPDEARLRETENA